MPTETLNKRTKLSKSLQISIFRRDGWLCRWCSKPVIFGPVMKYLEIDLRSDDHDGPLAYYHAHWPRAMSPLLDELGAIVDHVLSVYANGSADVENLVTSCAKCNSRKGSASPEEWAQRHTHRPVKSKYGNPDN